MRMTDGDVQAVLDCLRSGWLTMGPRTKELEAAFAEWTGAPDAVAVSSGTAALHLACRAAGLQPGDEVLVPAFGSAAAAEAPRRCGAIPVFCDVVSPQLPNVDVVDLERRVTDRTRAVVAVHLWGYPADVVLLRELCDRRGLVLIEDCTMAVGATVDHHGRQAGTIGDFGCFSFGERAQLAVGEGGMVTALAAGGAAAVRSLRSHAMTSGTWDRHRGHHDSYDIVDIGYNFRMDEPRAALALSRLERLAADLEARRRIVRRLRERLEGARGLGPCWQREDVGRSSHAGFPLLADARDDLAARLRRAGVLARVEGSLAEPPRAAEVARRHVLVELDPDGDADALADLLLAR